MEEATVAKRRLYGEDDHTSLVKDIMQEMIHDHHESFLKSCSVCVEAFNHEVEVSEGYFFCKGGSTLTF